MITHTSIQTRRKLLGLSQSALAQKAGLARETVNRFERQGTDIGLEAFGRLLAALGLVMKLEPVNEVVVKNWTQFEAQRRAELLAELRLVKPQRTVPGAAPARGVRRQRPANASGTGSKVLDWGKL